MPKVRLVIVLFVLVFGWWSCVAPLPPLEGASCQTDAECGQGVGCAPDNACRVRVVSGQACPTHRQPVGDWCLPGSSQEPSELTEPTETQPDPAEPQLADEPPVADEPSVADEPATTDADASPPEPPIEERSEPPSESTACPGTKPPCPYGGSQGTEGVGLCQAATATCVGKEWQCIGEVTPVAETCNGLDDDCDGDIDDEYPDRGKTCTVVGSSCKGTMVCENGQPLCKPQPTSAVEMCNGKDDDCDGLTDEGNPGGGKSCTISGKSGGCEVGRETCYKGAIKCRPIKAEICNSKDDNCDGDIDEGLGTQAAPSHRPCFLRNSTVGRCAIGREYCEAGAIKCAAVYTRPNVDTLCNGLDDDCDGLVDEDARGGCVKTLAGPDPAFFDGPAKDAVFYSPSAMVWDPERKLIYISERNGQRIRRYDTVKKDVLTIMGDGVGGDVDGAPGVARLHGPSGLALREDTRILFLADSYNNKIRALDLSTGLLTTYAGSGKPGFVDVKNTTDLLKAEFNNPNGVALSAQNTLWVADTNNSAIRKIDDTSVVTMAGRDPATGPTSGHKDGDALTEALFDRPFDLLFDPANRLMIVDLRTPVVRRYLFNGTLPQKGPSVETWLGDATNVGHANASGPLARFRRPYRLAFNNVLNTSLRGYLFISDLNNHDIRMVKLAGDTVSTAVAEPQSSKSPIFEIFLREPTAVLSYAKEELLFFSRRAILFRADWTTTPKKVSEVAGQNVSAFVDGTREKARFRRPMGIVSHGSLVYVADRDGHRIRQVTADGQVSTLIGDGTAGHQDSTSDPLKTQLNLPMALAMDPAKKYLYIAQANGGIRRYDLATKATMSLVGTGGACGWRSIKSTDKDFLCTEIAGAMGSRQIIKEPQGLAVGESSGEPVLYVSDTANHRIIAITKQKSLPEWDVSVLAGSYAQVGTADDKKTLARFNEPSGLALQSSSAGRVLYVADAGNHCIRKIELASGFVSTYAGLCGTSGWVDQTGALARFKLPTDIVASGTGASFVLHVTDSGNYTIRTIASSTKVTTLLRGLPSNPSYFGGHPPGYANGPLSQAKTSFLTFLALGPGGQIFVADTLNYALRVVLP